jgi:hypothetical protein
LALGWQGDYLLVVAFLTALEALYARRAIGRLAFPSREWLIYRSSEWVVLLVALKLLLYLLRGIDRLWLDLPGWREDFFPNFFSGEYLAAVLVMILVWGVSNGFAGDLMELESDERRLKAEILAGLPGNRPAAQQQVAGRIFTVGGLMIALTGLVHLDLGLLARSTVPSVWGEPGEGIAALNIVLFFLLGLLLLSQGQLSILRASWNWQRIEIAPDLVPRWAVLSVLFLVGIVVLASLLPTSYSVGLLATLGYLVQLVLGLLSLLAVFLLSLLFSLLGLLLRLLGIGETTWPALRQPTLGPPALLNSTGGPLWIEVLQSLVFWSVFLAVIGYSVYYFLKQRQDLATALVRLPVVSWLVMAWRHLRARLIAPLLARWRTQLATTVAGLRRPRVTTGSGSGRPAWRFFRLGSLSPRERVLYFYLATLRRATQGGLPRRPGQTPFEYAVDLRQAVPEAESDVEPLTQAFVEARYSEHLVARSQADAVQRHWERLKCVLVRLRRNHGRDQ